MSARALSAMLVAVALLAIEARETDAEVYRPWCVGYTATISNSCIFVSFEQCMMTATPGTGGQCVQNPWYLWYGEHGQGQGGDARLRPRRQ